MKYPKALLLAKEYQLEKQPFTTITTKKAETLMMVSFKLYGDYRLWMNIYHWNEEILDDSLEVTKGTVLKVKKPALGFSKPHGRPYFIKRGDSLSRISEKVYGEWRWWKEISKNKSQNGARSGSHFCGFYPLL
jgi:nucleoid-associated protein YgaU